MPDSDPVRERPNVLLVIGDDMAWCDCEPYGSPDVKTPNMARLAREGMTFDLAFTATASPTTVISSLIHARSRSMFAALITSKK